MEKYTDLQHPSYVPGTFNIYSNGPVEGDSLARQALGIKKDRNGVVLVPQPSDSPNDPLNWSYWRKIMHFALMAFITAFTAATSNDAGATTESLHSIYGITYDSMNVGAAVLFLGVGWSALLFSPLPSLFGRKLTYMICITLGLFGAMWFALATKTGHVIWSQLFVGMSESCAEAHVQLSLSDIFFQHQLGSVLTVYIMATSVGTFLGPLIAGYIASLTNFRWVGWCAVIISAFLLLWIVFGCEETYFDRRLYQTPLTVVAGHSTDEEDNKCSACAGTTTGAEKRSLAYASNTELNERVVMLNTQLIDGSEEPPKRYFRRIRLITRATNFRGWGVKQYFKYLGLNLRMFLFPPVWLSGLYWGTQDVFLSFYLTTQDTNFYDEPWNYSTYRVAIMNVPTLLGAVVGCMYAGVISDVFVLWLARRNNGILEAEFRLYFAAVAGIAGTLGLILFGYGAARALPWQTVYIGLAFIGFTWGSFGDIAMAYLMDCYPEMVLEGMACTAVINNTLSCIFTLTCSYLLDTYGNKSTYLALGLLNLGITLLAVPMFLYGKQIRTWSKPWYIQSVQIRDAL
ncbi:ADR337Cp [Eremothecium gossypii ATCC 10895]|uniref:ADR337Cp n=1 Tax=Eremothecium gossypii (strain ATCC 10895 / CBS 109.51 / FGSC 9923 / NRRL Y-1056) TaxID=284811 RepID=Q759E0_EREGS|nr:ADR337Cp [Eremothecium gossypii ATCC 10895]AAS52257.1 ADR337Cp [Eremothecium gossypii ATCC 10895]AEY96556.1 FADR337Cp [Eremothecium gossypii FDAG1]